MCGCGSLNGIEYLISLRDIGHINGVHEAMMNGILRFYNNCGGMDYDDYVIMKKMLSLVKEYIDYHNNMDNIVYLMSTYNDLNYGFMKNLYEYVRI